MPPDTFLDTFEAPGIQSLLAHGIDVAALAGPVPYRRSVNTRVPLFGGAE